MDKRDKIITNCIDAWKTSGSGRVLVAVSGGADSMALLSAVKLSDIPAEVAHCNFNLRGEESIRDRDFVLEQCNKLNIPCNLVEFDTLRMQLKGESIEMTCRRLRYDYFDLLKREKGFNRIMVAHNADDNIETFFINLLRGAGINGLKAMRQDNGVLLRPLIRTSRHEIIEFLKSQNQEYIIDSTNMESEFRRNFLRNEVLPLIETRWPGMREALTDSIKILQSESKIINESVDRILSKNKNVLPVEEILAFPDPLTLIHKFISPYSQSRILSSEILRSVKQDNIGKKWHFNDGVTVYTTRHGLKLTKDCSNDSQNISELYEWTVLSGKDRLNFEAGKETAYLPCPATAYKWVAANPQMKIRSLGMKGRQKVWKILKDAGLTPEERALQPVLIDKSTGEVIWVPGFKRSGFHLLDGTEDTVYKVSLKSKRR